MALLPKINSAGTHTQTQPQSTTGPRLLGRRPRAELEGRHKHKPHASTTKVHKKRLAVSSSLPELSPAHRRKQASMQSHDPAVTKSLSMLPPRAEFEQEASTGPSILWKNRAYRPVFATGPSQRHRYADAESDMESLLALSVPSPAKRKRGRKEVPPLSEVDKRGAASFEDPAVARLEDDAMAADDISVASSVITYHELAAQRVNRMPSLTPAPFIRARWEVEQAKVEVAVQRHKKMQHEQEMKILGLINAKERRRERERLQKHTCEVGKTWLMVFVHRFTLQTYTERAFRRVVQDRTRRRRIQAASNIQRFFKRQMIKSQWRSVAKFFSLIMRQQWRLSLQLRAWKRFNAANVLRKFVRDAVALGGGAKVVHRFTSQVKRVQRYATDFLQATTSRMTELLRILDEEGQRYLHQQNNRLHEFATMSDLQSSSEDALTDSESSHGKGLGTRSTGSSAGSKSSIRQPQVQVKGQRGGKGSGKNRHQAAPGVKKQEPRRSSSTSDGASSHAGATRIRGEINDSLKRWRRTNAQFDTLMKVQQKRHRMSKRNLCAALKDLPRDEKVQMCRELLCKQRKLHMMNIEIAKERAMQEWKKKVTKSYTEADAMRILYPEPGHAPEKMNFSPNLDKSMPPPPIFCFWSSFAPSTIREVLLRMYIQRHQELYGDVVEEEMARRRDRTEKLLWGVQQDAAAAEAARLRRQDSFTETSKALGRRGNEDPSKRSGDVAVRAAEEAPAAPLKFTSQVRVVSEVTLGFTGPLDEETQDAGRLSIVHFADEHGAAGEPKAEMDDIPRDRKPPSILIDDD